ncbi:uracil-DNA glycosylase [Alteromonas sp. ASW11-130]|uniref:uracil-DNA glycosylase n=1 Tax=Alteromonas sp. ASW11-130 TaxID=3015775 RepID=UPI0022423F6D|nr:uracil-DNA glycosylase [Alteromonas sp. ASW11-130]MCW8091775.1 uracil-DNA glycosylase [Alteromonas sp. ASW11-130]
MNWDTALAQEKQEPYFQHIIRSVSAQRQAGKVIYPPADEVFYALSITPLDTVKVVILGQDPYHGPGQAHGLSFSVQKGVAFPPSLRNMFKELQTDIPDFQVPSHGNLTSWAEQGVLLLNTVLTVEQGKAHSHAKLGWEQFTDRVIQVLNTQTHNTVFMLWGSHAQKKGKDIDATKHLVLAAPHPSPLSAHRGFFGCKHFSQANAYLQCHGKKPIEWQLER